MLVVGVLMRTYDSAKVPVFIIEEVEDVDGMDDVDNDHGVGVVTEFLVLVCGEGDVAKCR